MKRTIQFAAAVAVLLLTVACGKSGTDDPTPTPTPPTDKYNAADYGQLQLTHRGSRFDLPAVTGSSSLRGTVYWGDEQSEAYAAGRRHTYASEGEHRVTIDLWGAASVAFESLEGVEEIDFSKF